MRRHRYGATTARVMVTPTPQAKRPPRGLNGIPAVISMATAMNGIAVHGGLIPYGGTSDGVSYTYNGTVFGVSQVGNSGIPAGGISLTASQSIDVKSGDAVAVDVLNPGGGEAAFTVPPLPAPSGTATVAQFEAAMHGLSAYQYSEILSSGITTVSAAYASNAPDRTMWTVARTSQTILIGSTEYTRDAPGSPWRIQAGLSRNTVPSFVWDFFAPLSNAHVLGHAVLDGAPTTIVAGFGNKYASPIWFTFWVDAAGRVRQVAMDAPGHFMIDTYTSYNHPIPIDPPPAG